MNSQLPLINFPLIEFTRRICWGGKISLKGLFLLTVYYLQMIAALPFMLLQFLFYSKRIKKTIVSKDPVFILGHYRSGTTYLQKLMASDLRFGYLTNYDALFPNSALLFGKKMQPILQRLINLLKVKNPFFHDVIVQLAEPAEEDDYLMNKASAYTAYWGLVFPKRWREWLNSTPQCLSETFRNGWKRDYLKTIQYATFKNNGKQLVMKSPPNTERILLLLQMFPQAKFIFIYRNPFHMFYSIRNMWKGAILKFYSVQHVSERMLNEIIFGHFEYLMDKYETDKKLIPPGNLIEISYEELKEDAFGVMQKIYSRLNLPDFESTADRLKLQLEKEKGYQSFHYQLCDNTLNEIAKRWEKYILKWNYSVPDRETVKI
ncbi:MAG: sulfotransferase [Bacteroidota bacterium]|nr:sulfotransferase [Bacteroidota bacterium]